MCSSVLIGVLKAVCWCSKKRELHSSSEKGFVSQYNPLLPNHIIRKKTNVRAIRHKESQVTDSFFCVRVSLGCVRMCARAGELASVDITTLPAQ